MRGDDHVELIHCLRLRPGQCFDRHFITICLYFYLSQLLPSQSLQGLALRNSNRGDKTKNWTWILENLLCCFLPNKSSIVGMEDHTPCETMRARLHTTSVELSSQVLGGTSQAFKKVNSIGFATRYSHLIHTTKYGLKCTHKPGAWTQTHTALLRYSIFGTENLCTPSYTHTHMPFVVAGAQLVTSYRGEFISDRSAAAWRLSKAVLSSSCLKLPEPTDCLPVMGICLPRPEFASLYRGCLPSLRGSALHAVYQCQEN